MTNTPEKTDVAGPLIHVGFVRRKGPKKTFLYLRQIDKQFSWFEENERGQEQATHVSASSISQALRAAQRQWRDETFTPLHCGFRFTLPERDEIGRPAYFCEMVNSFKSMTGVYRDAKIDGNCIVQKPSSDALDLWHALEAKGRL